VAFGDTALPKAIIQKPGAALTRQAFLRGSAGWTAMPVNVRDFGACGDGESLDTARLQAAIDSCAKSGGGTVVVPPGNYVTGTLWMRSNITLHLESGAALLGSQNFDDFPLWKSVWEGPRAIPRRASLICGEDLENVSITGRGKIDGRGKPWWHKHWDEGEDAFRPFLFRVVNCRNVLVEGITFTNSPMWTVSPLACDNVTIRGITISNPPHSPNTDGINPDSCSNVRISDCHIDVGDDCITIKSGKEDDHRQTLKACENITITNCTLLHGHGGVVIGSEMSGCVRNVTISNCVFVGTDRGIRLKARRGRGGVVEDIRVNNLVMDGVLCPIVLNLFYGCGAWGEKKVMETAPYPVDEGTPRFRRLRFSNITARNVKLAAAYIMGLPEMFVEDVRLTDLSLYLDPHHTQAGPPDMSPAIPNYLRAGIIAEHVRDLVIRNVDVQHQTGAAVFIEDSEHVSIKGVRSHNGITDNGLIEMRDVRNDPVASLAENASELV
jgi:polygalacturonase